jgi:cation transporter-like permease
MVAKVQGELRLLAMTDRSPRLEGNLTNLQDGASAFRVLAIVLTVIGAVLLGAGALKLLPLLRDMSWTVVASALETAGSSIIYFLLAYLARRASVAFDAIAALIGELGEIV